jgi:hypothetical protein
MTRFATSGDIGAPPVAASRRLSSNFADEVASIDNTDSTFGCNADLFCFLIRKGIGGQLLTRREGS